MTLSIEKELLLERRMANEGKSTAVAYLLWFSLGPVSAHRFYLGRIGSALLQILLIFPAVGLFFLEGPAGLASSPMLLTMPVIGLLWLFLDLFLIPDTVRKQNNKLRLQLMRGLTEDHQRSKQILERVKAGERKAGLNLR